MMRETDVLIVGAGHSGLTASHLLQQQGRDHLLVEKGSAASAWRDHRWDSFHLVIPNRHCRFPGVDTAMLDPDGFLSRAEVVALFDQAVERTRLPLIDHTEVVSITPHDAGFDAVTMSGQIRCRNVIVATGPFQQPNILPMATALNPSIFQVHSKHYKNPAQLPDGNVLVVGSGQSGVQIADELLKAGRGVHLCVGGRGWLPRRYQGKDITTWYVEMGLFDTTVDSFASLAAAKASGFAELAGDEDRGRDLNFHTLARDGAILVGKISDGAGVEIAFSDIDASIAVSDRFAANARDLIDQYRLDMGLPDCAEDAWPVYQTAPRTVKSINLHDEKITSVVWASGYRPDFGFISAPVFDAAGFPVHRRGVTDLAGLFFVGLEWQHKRKSSTFMIGEEDIRFVLDRLV
jgi:putative flavoprotein involved in K+ transport